MKKSISRKKLAEMIDGQLNLPIEAWKGLRDLAHDLDKKVFNNDGDFVLECGFEYHPDKQG